MASRLFLFLAFLSLGSAFLVSCTQHSESNSLPPPIASQTKALFAAIIDNDLTAARSALKAGANIDGGLGEPGDEVTPLLAATALNRDLIAQYLLENGASPHATFKGYRVRDYAIRVLGDGHPITRELRTQGGF